MPVLILGGNEDLDIIRPLAEKLVADGGEVRCYLEEDDYELRSIGCKIAVGPLNDEMNVQGALTGVHTFIPILPDPLHLENEPSLHKLVDSARVWASTVEAASIEQTILALPGLREVEGPLGRVFGRTEEEFGSRCRPLTILRTGLWWGEERPLLPAVRWLSEEGEADAKISTLRIDSLVGALAAIDDLEQADGIWDLGGEVCTLAELRERAGPGKRRAPSDWMHKVLQAGLTVGNTLGLPA